MNEMIERVAQAIKSGMKDSGAVSLVANGPKGEAALQQFFEVLSMEAIAAMREPTDDMKRAGWHVLREKNDFQTRLGNSLVGTETPVFSAMIDAALR